MNGQQDPQKQINDLINGLGSFAEMVHIFYNAMVQTGASRNEATSAMQAYVFAFWHENMEDARRAKREGQQNGQGQETP